MTGFTRNRSRNADIISAAAAKPVDIVGDPRSAAVHIAAVARLGTMAMNPFLQPREAHEGRDMGREANAVFYGMIADLLGVETQTDEQVMAFADDVEAHAQNLIENYQHSNKGGTV